MDGADLSYLRGSKYTETGSASPSTDSIRPDGQQGSNVHFIDVTEPRKAGNGVGASGVGGGGGSPSVPLSKSDTLRQATEVE